MLQPWRTFSSINNKCLSRKITGLDKLRLLRAQIPWGMFYKKNVDFDSPAYKTYLAFATGATSPKKERKFKKPASPSRKSTLVTIEVVLELAKKKKKPAKAERSKGIDFLSEAALLEEAQVKKVLRRSRRETSIHQAGGSSDETSSTPGVPDEPKGKSVDTHKGTGLKPGVVDVSTADSSERENESWDDSGDEANIQNDDDLEQADDELSETDNLRISNEEEIQDDEYVHNPKDYVVTEDEMNDESNDLDEEEYERINEELYGDVNIRLTDAEPDDEEQGTKEMIDVGHVDVEHENVNQEGAGNQVMYDAQATQKTEVPIPSSSVSSDYAAKYLNFDNIPSAETEVFFMMDINVQHQVPHTSSLLTIPKDVQELKNIDNSTKVISTIKSEVPKAVKEYFRSSLDDALHKVIQRNFADIVKEHSVPSEIVERLRKKYAP
ncbi:hypothetical protein Tco_1398633 [Tanacetum coccineum]